MALTIFSAITGLVFTLAFAFGAITVGQVIAWIVRLPWTEENIWFFEICLRFIAIAVILMALAKI
jgi:hypothetical protein